MSHPGFLRIPSALLPVAMSAIALATVLAFLAIHGPAPLADEGAAAHLWQLLMAGQVPIVAYFAIRWVRRAPRWGFLILVVQFVAVLAAAAPVYILRW